jgi:hypothetical protein
MDSVIVLIIGAVACIAVAAAHRLASFRRFGSPSHHYRQRPLVAWPLF